MKLSLHAKGEANQRRALKEELQAQIKWVKAASDLSEAEKKEKIAALKLSFKEELSRLKYNLY